MLTLPGLIDPHVHLRTPGQEGKEDFYTGTSAALAGGYTTIIDMPNNTTPITTGERLDEKISLAEKQTVCDIGFHFGSLGENFDEFPKVQNKVLGLKIYLNQTTGGYIVDEHVFEKICNAWPKQKPILVHAEENIIEKILEIGNRTGQKIHVAHVSSAKELQTIINAKMKGYQVTCGVTPHHLFLNIEQGEKLGAFGKMKPTLKPQADVDFLWNHLQDIDIVESDHAPHTIEEKMHNIPTPNGVPGLETTLPLLLTAVHEDKLTIADIKRLCYEGPKKIFLDNVIANKTPVIRTLPGHPQLARSELTGQISGSYIDIDENEEWTIENKNLFTKCKWSPFNGWKVKGKVKRVYIRGEKVFADGKILAKPGFGRIIKTNAIV